MTAVSEIRKAYISLIGSVTGLLGFDTEMPKHLYNTDIKEYFTVSLIRGTDEDVAKGLSTDNMAYRQAGSIVIMQVQVFQVGELGFVSNYTVEQYASQIEDTIKRQLQVYGWSIYETVLDDIQPMNVLGTSRMILTFQHRLGIKNVIQPLPIIDTNPIEVAHEIIYDGN